MNKNGFDLSQQRLRCVSFGTMMFMCVMIGWVVPVNAFKLSTTSRVIRTRTRSLNMITLPTGGEDDYLGELIQQNELASAFSLFLKDSSMKPSKEQTITLLNNMDVLANNFPLENVAKFYGRIQKLSVTSSDVIVPSFGSMSVDGPLTQINLPRFESILAFEPEILYQGMGINDDVFHRLKVNTTPLPFFVSNDTPSNQSLLRTNTILTRTPCSLLFSFSYRFPTKELWKVVLPRQKKISP